MNTYFEEHLRTSASEIVIDQIKTIQGKDLHSIFRSSSPGVFYKKDVLENLAKFTGKHLWP